MVANVGQAPWLGVSAVRKEVSISDGSTDTKAGERTTVSVNSFNVDTVGRAESVGAVVP